MVERPAQVKNEQYPLLEVTGAAGDANIRLPLPANTAVWHSTCTIQPRRSWFDRWPEYVSTCWMTFILLGITFLAFYAIGMVMMYRHDAFILSICNDTKYVSDVFCHSLITRGTSLPLANTSSYLADLATQYPLLRFNVIFLIDDSGQNVIEKRNLYNKLYPYNAYHQSTFYDDYVIYNVRDIREFERKYRNVNITVTLLSKYMAMTPLKCRWRHIPVMHIPFYARIFSVWLNGGVGFDLAKFNEYYLTGNKMTRRIHAILKQHNDGIVPEKYFDSIKKIQAEEQTEVNSAFFNMMQSIINETFVLLNKPFPLGFSSDDSVSIVNPLIPIHRSRRDTTEQKETNNTSTNDTIAPMVVNIILENKTTLNVSGDSNKDYVYQKDPLLSSSDDAKRNLSKLTQNNTFIPVVSKQNQSSGEYFLKLFENPVVGPAPVEKIDGNTVSFDFSVITKTIFVDSEPRHYSSSSRNMELRNKRRPQKLLTIDSKGSFVASTSDLHPFLASVLSSGCKYMSPDYAIENALFLQCSGLYREDFYCNNIFVF